MEVIRLNVGGKVFLTTRATLCAEPGSMLATLFDGDSPFEGPDQLDDGSYFLDRPHHAFEYVLNYLRCSLKLLKAPPKKILPQLRNDADYYGLAGLVMACNAIPEVPKAQPAPQPQYELCNNENSLLSSLRQGWSVCDKIKTKEINRGTNTRTSVYVYSWVLTKK